MDLCMYLSKGSKGQREASVLPYLQLEVGGSFCQKV